MEFRQAMIKNIKKKTMLKLFKIGLSLSFIILNIATLTANERKMIEQVPFYTVSIESRNIAYQLLINDIPVLNSYSDFSGTVSKYVINPWLLNGKNSFKVRILPVANSTTDPTGPKICKVVISGPKDKGMTETILAEAEAIPSDVSKEGSFAVTLEYPSPKWAASEKISRDAVTQKKILDKFKEFHLLLEKKDLNGIMKFANAKFKAYSQSIDDPNFISDKQNSFKEQLAAGSKLIGIDVQEKNGLLFEYYYGDRLVTIKNDDDRSIIQYYDGDEGVTTQYPLLFYFDGKDFVLIL